jgi:hypothetical protein
LLSVSVFSLLALLPGCSEGETETRRKGSEQEKLMSAEDRSATGGGGKSREFRNTKSKKVQTLIEGKTTHTPTPLLLCVLSLCFFKSPTGKRPEKEEEDEDEDEEEERWKKKKQLRDDR